MLTLASGGNERSTIILRAFVSDNDFGRAIICETCTHEKGED